MWGFTFPSTVEERACKSQKLSMEENNRKRLEGEDKMIRALARANDKATCLITPRSTYSGLVDVEWNGNKDSRMEGYLTIDTESASQHLLFPTNSDFYTALQDAATHGPVPIKIFCDNSPSMQGVEEAMEKGLNSKETLLGHLFCSKIVYTSLTMNCPLI